MKAICDGTTTRHDVVQQNLEQYRAVFVRTIQQMDVIKAVSFTQATDTAGGTMTANLHHRRCESISSTKAMDDMHGLLQGQLLSDWYSSLLKSVRGHSRWKTNSDQTGLDFMRRADFGNSRYGEMDSPPHSEKGYRKA
jgi:hypothetical protein